MSNTYEHVSMEIGETNYRIVLEGEESVAPVMGDPSAKPGRRKSDEANSPTSYEYYNPFIESTRRQADSKVESPPRGRRIHGRGYVDSDSRTTSLSGANIEYMSDDYVIESRNDIFEKTFKTDKNILMHKERAAELKTVGQCQMADSDPPVLWAAIVFDSNDIRRSGRIDPKPKVTYFDDRPLQLHLPNEEERRANSNAMVPVEPGSDCVPSWNGSVIEVHVAVQAQVPRKGEGHTRIVNKKSGQVPKSPNSLKIDRVSRSQIIIKSPFILRTLNRIVGYYPSIRVHLAFYSPFPLNVRTECVVPEPFAALMHCFSEIERFVNTNTVEESKLLNDLVGTCYEKELLQLEKSHMCHVYKFLRPLHDASMNQYHSHISEPSPRVSFDMLWYLFRPGIDVYMLSEGVIHTCVVTRVWSNIDDAEKGPETTTVLRYWVLDLWYLDTDGTRIARVQTLCRISKYSGVREVIRLEACPATIWDASDGGERRQKILKARRIHAKALNQDYLLARYDGPTLQRRRYYNGSIVVDHRRGLLQPRYGPPPTFSPIGDYSGDFGAYDSICINDRKKVDNEAWLRDPADSKGAVTPDRKEWQAGKDIFSLRATMGQLSELSEEPIIEFAKHDLLGPVQSELTDHQLLLLYPRTYCFALKIKQWMSICTDFITEISSSEESLQNLVVGENELKTIRALSNRQNRKNDSWAADFIEGKGTGQIILLHGPPGVGKTYTVEAIAEWLRRPLLALTVADIGTAETRIEGELIKWFSLAEAWSAVLLVDEADIFLERRQNRDLARNGLVSAFLRRMEYFQGLLFLTTNRVGQIDDAFVSRVHVAIGYKLLSPEDRRRIWNGFFKKLVKERAGKIQIAADAKRWVLEVAGMGEVAFNGRDIRNALQTAIALAESDCAEDPEFDSSKETIVVLKDHFQRVLAINNKFHEYVASIRREDEKKRAAGRGDRNDYDDGA